MNHPKDYIQALLDHARHEVAAELGMPGVQVRTQLFKELALIDAADNWLSTISTEANP